MQAQLFPNKASLRQSGQKQSSDKGLDLVNGGGGWLLLYPVSFTVFSVLIIPLIVIVCPSAGLSIIGVLQSGYGILRFSRFIKCVI